MSSSTIWPSRAAAEVFHPVKDPGHDRKIRNPSLGKTRGGVLSFWADDRPRYHKVVGSLGLPQQYLIEHPRSSAGRCSDFRFL
jgi:hypothetical protein